MKDLELLCFEIIANVGTARSSYIEAIQFAKKGEYEKAEELIKQGDEAYKQGHRAHAELIAWNMKEASAPMNMLMAHAEDQLMSAEAFQILCVEFMDVYRTIHAQAKPKSECD